MHFLNMDILLYKIVLGFFILLLLYIYNTWCSLPQGYTELKRFTIGIWFIFNFWFYSITLIHLVKMVLSHGLVHLWELVYCLIPIHWKVKVYSKNMVRLNKLCAFYYLIMPHDSFLATGFLPSTDTLYKLGSFNPVYSY